MKFPRFCHPAALLGLALSLTSVSAGAHFLQLIPSAGIVDQGNGRQLQLDIAFSHPMERGPVMEMASPVSFGVLTPAGRENLLDSLVATEIDGNTAYTADYRIRRPGDHLFYLQPAPYWEAAEGKMIIHYTKVVVDAFSGQHGWDSSVGFPVEIEPLVRPYGLWSGNLFRGIVRKNGQPVPFAEIEVEWLNDGSVTAPAAPFVTQQIRADSQGVFSYAMPRSGWWGFAALLEGDQPMNNPEGQPVPVEEGGLIWVHTVDMKQEN